jgi:hypothetical protein
MKASYKHLTLIGATILCLASAVSAQGPKGLEPKKPQPAPSPDKIQAVDFKINPSEPQAGSQATLKLTIKNVTGDLLKGVPWILGDGDIGVQKGMNDIPAGGTVNVEANLNIAPGRHSFYGIADPENTLGEFTFTARANNSRQMAINVPLLIGVISPGSRDSIDAGISVTVRWNAPNVSGDVRIELLPDGAGNGPMTLVEAISASAGSRVVTIPTPPNPGVVTSGRIRVTSINNDTITGTSDQFRFRAIAVVNLRLEPARNEGAEFPTNPESPPLGCELKTEAQVDGQIRTMIRCNSSLNGLKANPEYFKNFTLKNGWKVKFAVVRDDGVVAGVGRGNWSWRTQPAAGSTNPYAQIHLACEARTDCQVYLTVVIEGPPRANPFR